MKRLQEIEARLNAATPNEWSFRPMAFTSQIIAGEAVIAETKMYPKSLSDGMLIAAAPSDIRALLDAVKVMQESLELIAETKTKTLLGRCCVDNACYKDEDGCSATVTAHNAFYQNAHVAQQARAKVREILG